MGADCRSEQEALQQLRQPGSLPSAEVAHTLVHDVTQRTQEHGADDVSQELLQLIAERCSAAGEHHYIYLPDWDTATNMSKVPRCQYMWCCSIRGCKPEWRNSSVLTEKNSSCFPRYPVS